MTRTERWTLLLVAALGAMPGCGPLLGVRAIVTLDEQTVLTREALGPRAGVPPRVVLLPLEAPEGAGLSGSQLRGLLAECLDVQAKLADAPAPDAELRTWQMVAGHNEAVLRYRLGEVEQARRRLDELIAASRRWRSGGSLTWQLELTAAMMAGPALDYDMLRAAADHLLRAAVLSEMDYALEGPRRRARLYALAVVAALEADQPEEALRYALEHEAVELARSVPPGRMRLEGREVAALAASLARLRREAARARDDADPLAPPEDGGHAAVGDLQTLHDLLDQLAEVSESLRAGSPAGGLLVPDPADPAALREVLGAATGLLIFEPAGEGRYAAFLLTEETFAAVRVGPLPPPEDELSSEYLQALDRALLAPFARELAGMRRLYVVPGSTLTDVPWERLPRVGGALAEDCRLVFLGGASDLQWAFRQKRYGRRLVLICGEGLTEAQAAPDETVAFFDTARGGRADLAAALAFPDAIRFTATVRLDRASPEGSHLPLRGEGGPLARLSAAEMAGLDMRAGVACFRLPPDGPGRDSFAALRVFTRAVIAGGVPTVLYSAAPDGPSDRHGEVFLQGLRDGLAADTHGRALAEVDAQHRPAIRLYGFAGMSETEYAEHSKLAFNDIFRGAVRALKEGRHAEAAAGFLNARRMVQVLPLGEKKALYLANIDRYLVESWHGLERYGEAARHQRMRIERLETLGPDAADMAEEYQSLGALLTEAGQFDAAREAYATSIAKLPRDEKGPRLARLLGESGKSLDRAGRYEEAVQTFGQAAEAWRALNDAAGLAQQYQRIGAIYLKRLGDARRARKHFEDAFDLYGKVEDEAQAIETEMDVGLCRRREGDFEGALATFERALARAEAAGLSGPAMRALTEAGNTHWLRGEYQQALALVGRSNEMAVAGGSDFQLNVNHQLLALIYWELNQHDRAHRALDTAVAAARRARSPLEIASAHNNRGLIYRRQGMYEKALDSFRQALEIDRRLRTRWGQAYDLRNIGITLHRLGRLDEAAEHLTEAVALCRAIGDRTNLAKAALALGEVRAAQGRAADALPLLHEALREARGLHLPEVEWRALRARGRVHWAAGDDAAALDAVRQAIDVVEKMRGAIKIEEFRSGFLANKMNVYEDAVGLLLDMDRPADAFTYAERARARKFIDLLAGQTFELKTERERKLYAKQQELSRRIRSAREALARAEDAAERGKLAAQLGALQGDYSDVLVEIRAANPALSSFISVDVVGPRELTGALGGRVTLIAYFMMRDELAVWVWRDGGMVARRVPIGRVELARRVRRYRTMVQNRELLEEVRTASRELDAVLLRPIAGLLGEGRMLCIVPHRELHYLSFASLYDGESFLVERRAVFYSPSASVLARTLRREALPAPRDELKVLAIGNPAVGDRAYELPFTEQEVASLRRDFVNVTDLLGEKATEDWVRANIAGFDVVHFGAHGHFDPVNPLFSSLMLAPGEQQDGLLHLHEVTSLRINARLVTLSACQSALGALNAGDDLVSLARAFSYAGTRTILSTLWRVDDLSTALVSKHFYRHYAGRGGAEGLRQAQLRVMNDGHHYHPAYWAGVVLTGDPR